VAVPDFQTIMRPLLALHIDGQEHEIAATRSALAEHFDLSPADRQERIPSGSVSTLQNRVGWAATYLFRAGLLERPRRAHYRITKRGRAMLDEYPERIDLSVLKQFEEFGEFRERGRTSFGSSVEVASGEGSSTAEEQIDAGYRELQAALAADLLDRVKEQSWEFFERLVLEVLQAMGYGGPEGAVERLGGQGSDGGLDGVVREDPLGLDLIYIQAKSWGKSVGRPGDPGLCWGAPGKTGREGDFHHYLEIHP
jgi:restriction system protein